MINNWTVHNRLRPSTQHAAEAHLWQKVVMVMDINVYISDVGQGTERSDTSTESLVLTSESDVSAEEGQFSDADEKQK